MVLDIYRYNSIFDAYATIDVMISFSHLLNMILIDGDAYVFLSFYAYPFAFYVFFLMITLIDIFCLLLSLYNRIKLILFISRINHSLIFLVEFILEVFDFFYLSSALTLTLCLLKFISSYSSLFSSISRLLIFLLTDYP